jgi:hypothetical protein
MAAVCGALLLALFLAALAAPSSVSGAAVPTMCAGVSGGLTGHPDHLRGCTLATTGGSGELSSIGSDLDLVTGRNGGTTTYKITGAGTPEGTCRAGEEQVSNVGKVTHSTGAASGIRGQVSVTVCFPPSGRPVHLAQGATFDF